MKMIVFPSLIYLTWPLVSGCWLQRAQGSRAGLDRGHQKALTENQPTGTGHTPQARLGAKGFSCDLV